MTLEQDNTEIGKEISKKRSFAFFRRKRVLRKSHLREMKGLEEKEALGIDFRDSDKERLQILRDIYD